MEETSTASQTYQEMNELLSTQKNIRNFTRQIDMSNSSYVFETSLFPLEALKVYSAYNLEQPIEEKDRLKYFSAHRGGSQGDYRDGMQKKIENVVDCLTKFPKSKRALITIPNTSFPSHSSDEDAKCMREIHFYLEEGGDTTTMNLNATVWMRAQAAEIFPKNIHFIGSLMDDIAMKLNSSSNNAGNVKNSGKIIVGKLYYLATTLVSVRED